jgi:hypothetical protein
VGFGRQLGKVDDTGANPGASHLHQAVRPLDESKKSAGGWRLKLLCIYVGNGQPLYPAAWRPQTGSERQV